MVDLVPAAPPRLPNADAIDFSKPEEVRDYLLRLTSAMQRHLSMRAPQTTAVDGRTFKAPDGKVYTLSINNAGVVVVTPFGSAQTKPVPP